MFTVIYNFIYADSTNFKIEIKNLNQEQVDFAKAIISKNNRAITLYDDVGSNEQKVHYVSLENILRIDLRIVKTS